MGRVECDVRAVCRRGDVRESLAAMESPSLHRHRVACTASHLAYNPHVNKPRRMSKTLQHGTINAHCGFADASLTISHIEYGYLCALRNATLLLNGGTCRCDDARRDPLKRAVIPLSLQDIGKPQ